MNKELLQERKKMIYDFICDELYVPMKAKEMAIVLNVPKSQRGELVEVLDALVAVAFIMYERIEFVSTSPFW